MPAYSHLLDEERDQIAVMRAAGRSICAIARALQRAKSTVSRELRRNGLSSGRYSPLHAAGAYQLRRRREAILEKDQKLRTFVCGLVESGKRTPSAGGGLRDDLRLHLPRLPKGRTTSLPSSLRIAWNGVLKPRHFLGVRLAVRTMSWISSSDTLSMSI